MGKPASRVLVQFCPCGHTSHMDQSLVESQVSDPGKLDAPILPSTDCPDCEEDFRRRERMWENY